MIKLGQNNLERGFFTRDFEKIFIRMSTNPPPTEWRGHSETLKDYLDLPYKTLGLTYQFLEPDETHPNYNIPESKKLLLAFSGGRDSVAASIKARQMGYEPILFTVLGVNRSYRKEGEIAKQTAKLLNFQHVDRKVIISGKCDYYENPTKNQFILAAMVDYGIKNKIHNFAFGNFVNEKVAKVDISLDFSDGYETFTTLDSYFRRALPNYNFVDILERPMETNLVIYSEDPKIMDHTMFCILPDLYRRTVREKNERKFNIKLSENRCGGCYKCTREYIMEALCNLAPIDPTYAKFCGEIIFKKLDELKLQTIPRNIYYKSLPLQYEKETDIERALAMRFFDSEDSLDKIRGVLGLAPLGRFRISDYFGI